MSNHSKYIPGTNIRRSTISEDVPSYANDPYFVEKGKRCEEVIKRVGLPEAYLKKTDEKNMPRNKKTSK